MTSTLPAHVSALGLTRHPFPPTPDAQSYFFTQDLERDFAGVAHCVLAHKGIVLLTGEVGLGKTTFVRRLIETLEPRGVVFASVFNTFLQGEALLRAINRDFGIPAQGDSDAHLAALNAFLLEQAGAGKTCLLVIDDAQNLSVESLEMVRLLSNLETAQDKLLQIVLSGQPELDTTLARTELRQLASRIVMQVRLRRLAAVEILRYFEFRLAQAGGAGRIRLQPKALSLLHRHSGGNARRIHLILDRCLYGLVARRSSDIDATLMQEAVADIGRPGHGAPAARRHRTPALIAAMAALAVGGAALAAWHTGAIFPPGAEKPAPAAASAPPEPEPEPLPSPLPSPSLAAVAHSPPASDRQPGDDCMGTITRGGDNAAPSIRLVALPAPLAPLLDPDQSLCVFERGGRHWAAWATGWRMEDLVSPRANGTVLRLQQHLARLGLLGEADIDGYMGPRTHQALAAYRERNGLAPGGGADDLTLLLLERGVMAATQGESHV